MNSRLILGVNAALVTRRIGIDGKTSRRIPLRSIAFRDSDWRIGMDDWVLGSHRGHPEKVPIKTQSSLPPAFTALPLRLG